jgi:hypothetical protein
MVVLMGAQDDIDSEKSRILLTLETNFDWELTLGLVHRTGARHMQQPKYTREISIASCQTSAVT